MLDDKACEILVSVGYLLFFPKLHDLAAQDPIMALCLRQCIEVRYSDEYVRPLTVLSFWDPLLAMQEWPKWIWKERSSRQRADEECHLKKQLKEYIAACNNCTTSPLLRDMGANTEGR